MALDIAGALGVEAGAMYGVKSIVGPHRNFGTLGQRRLLSPWE